MLAELALSLLIVFNGEHDKEARNLLASIQQNAPELIQHISVCVSDQSSLNFALENHLNHFNMDAITESGTFMSKKMNIMTRRKFECIVHELERGKNVLYIDTDVVLLTNPLPYIKKTFDLNIQNDQCKPPYDTKYLCSGFMYIRPAKHTVDFFTRAIAMQHASDYKLADQCALNALLNENRFRMKVHVLDVCKFPNGCRYFDQTDKNCKQSDAIIVHNNYLVGVENKLQRFSKYGLDFYAKN